LGDSNANTTSYHRFKALERIGHCVVVHDPFLFCKKYLISFLGGRFHYRTGYHFLQSRIIQFLKFINFLDVDVIWINGGELFGKNALQYIRNLNIPTILYNNDDPTGGRDGMRFHSLLSSLPYFDLCVVMRQLNIAEFESRGAKNVIRLTMSYDEVAHKCYENFNDIPQKYISDVCFVGTWMKNEGRDIFLKALIDKGINISIWGDRWEKSPHFKTLKKYYKGPSIGGKDYVAAIQGAKICIGMLSKGNRDTHTTRSFEIPYIGGLLCAERTSEHLEMFKDKEEAFFWDNADECISICKYLLSNLHTVEQVKLAGHKKILELKVGNEDICKKILKELSLITHA